MENSHVPYGFYEKYMKRPLDVLFALAALIILWPVFVVIALLVRKNLGSPVIFSQERPGKDERIFRLYKFRSMTTERDKEGNILSDEIRLTDFGKKLRATSLDELPELWNILKGDMTFIGPRPLLVKYLPYYTKEQRHRHDVRPGLSGYAQVHGRNLISWEERFQLDLQYVNKITCIGDLQIIMATIGKVWKKEGISSETAATMESFDEYAGNVQRREKGS